MNNLIKRLSLDLIKKCKKTKQPTFVEPMLATLTKDYFSSSEWLYEHKFDGERCIVIKHNGIVSLLSRNRTLINDEYPELASAFEKQKADNFIVDGEIIARDSKGLSNFELLQSRINLQALEQIKTKVKTTPVVLCIFDCMYVDGYDIRKLPLLTRKGLLKNLLSFNRLLLYTEHTTKNGLALFKKACTLHWEGLIVKRPL